MYHGEIPYPDSRTAGQDPPRCPRQRTRPAAPPQKEGQPVRAVPARAGAAALLRHQDGIQVPAVCAGAGVHGGVQLQCGPQRSVPGRAGTPPHRRLDAPGLRRYKLRADGRARGGTVICTGCARDARGHRHRLEPCSAVQPREHRRRELLQHGRHRRGRARQHDKLLQDGHLRQGPEGSFVEHRPVGVLRQRGRV